MASPKLEAFVKGAPISPDVVPSAPVTMHHPKMIPSIPQTPISSQVDPSDPTTLLPSSPPQIYLNLLILEASLRAQHLTLRSRHRQHTLFVFLLLAWNLLFAYNLFLRRREDGQGIGGSVYWMVELGQKMGLMAGVLTGVLLWGTGQWERGIRWPQRWIGVANRGLRGFNVKIVVVRRGWLRDAWELLGLAAGLLRARRKQRGARFAAYGEKARAGSRVQDEEMVETDEDLEPGGDYVKLLLLPKSFSPEFREAWEVYRSEYWERENDRRAQLRIKLRRAERDAICRARARFWWLGIGPSNTAPTLMTTTPMILQKAPAGTRSRRASTLKERGSRQHLLLPPGDDKPARRHHRYSTTSSRSDSLSRASSRSSTPNSDLGSAPSAAAAAAVSSDGRLGRSESGSGSRQVTRSAKRNRVGVAGMTSPAEEEQGSGGRGRRYALRGGSSGDESAGTPPADESLEARLRMASPLAPSF